MALDSSFKAESSFGRRASSKRKPSSSSVTALSQNPLATDNDKDKDKDQDHNINEMLLNASPRNTPLSNQNISVEEAFQLAPLIEANYAVPPKNSPKMNESAPNEFENFKSSARSAWTGLSNSSYIDQIAHSQHVPVPIAMTLNNDDPLIFLKTQEATILSNLNEVLAKHSESLKKGHGRVKKIRQIILNQLNRLHEVHQAMNEIYTAERTNRMELLQKFDTWEAKKQQLLTIINDIQSDNNEDGVKYRQLATETRNCDLEIVDLERKLKLAKQKRHALRQELQSTQSIIESRVSSYIESLEVIENNEEAIIGRLSNTDLSDTLESPELKLPKNISAPSATNVQTRHKFEEDTMLSLSKSLNFSNFFSPRTKTSKRLDVSNFGEPLRARIDVGATTDSLRRQIEAINDELEHQESASFQFQESSIIWNESIQNVSQMEVFFKELKSSHQHMDDTNMINTLNETLDLLTKKLEMASKFHLTIVSDAIFNEIGTILTALYIITNDEAYLERLQKMEKGIQNSSGLHTPSSDRSVAPNNKNEIKIPSLHSNSTSSLVKISSPSETVTNELGLKMHSVSSSPPVATLLNSGPSIISTGSTSVGRPQKSSEKANRTASLFGSLSFSNNDKVVKKD